MLSQKIAKAWFYEQGLRQLRQRANEVKALYEQVLERHQTSKRLERGDQDVLLATRKELARADARVKQLKRAEKLAHKALVVLTGNKGIKVELRSSVKPLPAALSMRLLAGRTDVYRAAEELLTVVVLAKGPPELLPEIPLTAKGGRATRQLNRWSRYKVERIRKELGLALGEEDQNAAAEAFSRVLLQALRELRRSLNDGGKLVGQRTRLQSAQQKTRRRVNKLRARYSARRADLTDILQAQIEFAEIAGKLAYVQSRVFGQRLDSYLTLGGGGF
jgi:outer membrane protein TolC